MDGPMISIKVKGLQAIQALNGQLLGGMNLKGGAVLLRLKDMDNGMMMKNGLGMMRDMEMEGRRLLLLRPEAGPNVAPSLAAKGGGMMSAPAAKAAVAAAPPVAPVVVAAKSAVAKATMLAPATAALAAPAVAAKSAAVTAGAAAKAAVVPAAVLSGLGWGIALGALWPWVAFGSAGLAATGIYFYVQARRMVADAPEWNVQPGA